MNKKKNKCMQMNHLMKITKKKTVRIKLINKIIKNIYMK